MDIQEQQQQLKQEISNNYNDDDIYTTINKEDEQQQQSLVTTTTAINRNTWLRTSLRRSPIHSNKENLPNRRWGSFRMSSSSSSSKQRQLGSNALASELYRSSSFNSSGRSSTLSNNDNMSMSTTDDISMYSDASLEDDVLDLNHKVEQLQQQVNILTTTTTERQQQLNNNSILLLDNDNNNNNNNDKYIRIKTENATLQLRVMMLEEQLHDNEIHFNERIEQENIKYKELLQRNEREKQLLYDNYQIKLQQYENEIKNNNEELQRQKQLIDCLRNERKTIQEQLINVEQQLIEYKTKLTIYMENDKKLLMEQEYKNNIIQELNKELIILKQNYNNIQLNKINELNQYIQELIQQLDNIRKENLYLNELNDELNATIQLNKNLEKGKILLLNNTNINNTNNDLLSLADEFEAMSQQQMQIALKEQQDVNNELRAYIEGILLNIVENSPQLLEVKKHQQQQQQQTILSSTLPSTSTSTSL